MERALVVVDLDSELATRQGGRAITACINLIDVHCKNKSKRCRLHHNKHANVFRSIGDFAARRGRC